jgi:putative DNA primase/helicase
MVEINSPPGECYVYRRRDEEEAPKDLNIVEIIKWLQSQFHFASFIDTDEIYYYYNGIYLKNGDKMINKILEEAFGELTDRKGRLLLTSGIKSIIRNKIRDTSYANRNDFDKDVHIINMQNGLYNWKTKEFKEHTPEYLSLIQIPTCYDPEADCPNIKKSFNAAIEPDDIIKIREFIAYCLYYTTDSNNSQSGYPIQKAFILYGPGKSGKSFIMMIILMFVGAINKSSVGLQDMGDNRFATSDMYGKLLNLCGDIDGTFLKRVGNFKTATSGLEPLRAEEKGLKPFEFVNAAKMLFGANKLLKCDDRSTGYFRRIEPIIMKKLDHADIPHLPKKEDVTTPSEMSGLFKWVIETLPGLIERGSFTNERPLEDVISMYVSASNPIDYFIENYLEEAPNNKVPKKRFYEAFEAICYENNVFDIPSQTKFWLDLRKYIPDLEIRSAKVDGEFQRCIIGYKLKYTWDSDKL